MEFTACKRLKERKPADILVLPFFQKSGCAIEAVPSEEFAPYYSQPIEMKDFTGKEGEILLVYCAHKQEKRIALLGLGQAEKLTVESLRRAYGQIQKCCAAKKARIANLLLPTSTLLSDEDLLRGSLEGILIANYAFTKLKGEKKELPVLLEKLSIITPLPATTCLALAKKYAIIHKGVSFARDLVNHNADEITPQYLAQVASDLAQSLPNTHAHLLERKELEKQKLGLLLAVSRGSDCDPALITLSYQGDAKSTKNTVLVGKGVTYDTGGLNLKPTGGIETMKCDMAGAAAVLGILQVVATLKLKINLHVVIPSTENAISAKSYKPGDVYVSYSGKTVEIGNTDAEGRLILADALSYAIKTFKPSRIIDFATLTGAVDIALGPEASGLFTNDDHLANKLYAAGESSFERVWRLPLYSEYRDQLKSEIADIKNVAGRSAGSIKAALFLKEFVENLPWAHLDIASTAYLNEPKRYLAKHATGVGVRLMVDFFENEC